MTAPRIVSETKAEHPPGVQYLGWIGVMSIVFRPPVKLEVWLVDGVMWGRDRRDRDFYCPNGWAKKEIGRCWVWVYSGSPRAFRPWHEGVQ